MYSIHFVDRPGSTALFGFYGMGYSVCVKCYKHFCQFPVKSSDLVVISDPKSKDSDRPEKNGVYCG